MFGFRPSRETITDPEELKRVTLSQDAIQAGLKLTSDLKTVLQKTEDTKGERGQFAAAAETLSRDLTLEFPEAAEAVKKILEKSVMVYGRVGENGFILVEMRLGEAIMDPHVYIPESSDGSGAFTVQQLIGIFGGRMIPGALNYAETLKQNEVDKALLTDPLKPLPKKPFGSRGGTAALISTEVLSGVSAVPNYFAVGAILSYLLPEIRGELVFALSVYAAGAGARAVNIFDREAFRRAMHYGQGYWSAVANMFRDQSVDGRKLAELAPGKGLVWIMEKLAKRSISAFDGVVANIKGVEKKQRDESWTWNPEVTMRTYAVKAVLVSALSLASTGWGFTKLFGTQEEFEKSVDAAATRTMEQREGEVRKWVEQLTSSDADPKVATIPNILNADLMTEDDGKTRTVGGNVIKNQSAGANKRPGSGEGGVAYSTKKKMTPKVVEDTKIRAGKAIAEQRAKILRDFEFLKKFGMVLPENKLKELADTYVDASTKYTAEKTVEEIEDVANEVLKDYSKQARSAEAESRFIYKVKRADPIVDYDFKTVQPNFQPLNLDLKEINRPDFFVVLAKEKGKGNKDLVLFILKAILLTFILEKGTTLLLLNIAGRSKHWLKNKITGAELPYITEKLPGSYDQQVNTSPTGFIAGVATGAGIGYRTYKATYDPVVTGAMGAVSIATLGVLGSGYPGAKEEGVLTSVEDETGKIQRMLDAQESALVDVYTKALMSLNYEYSRMLPGAIKFTKDSIRSGVSAFIQRSIDRPPLFDRVIEPLMAPGAIKRRREKMELDRLLRRQRVPEGNVVQALLSNFRSGEFQELVGTMMPIKAYLKICELAEKGSILDVARAVRLANIAWEKTGKSDNSACRAVKDVARDWRSIDSKLANYESEPDPGEIQGRRFVMPNQAVIPRRPSTVRSSTPMPGSPTGRDCMAGDTTPLTAIKNKRNEGIGGLELPAINLEDASTSLAGDKSNPTFSAPTSHPASPAPAEEEPAYQVESAEATLDGILEGEFNHSDRVVSQNYSCSKKEDAELSESVSTINIPDQSESLETQDLVDTITKWQDFITQQLNNLGEVKLDDDEQKTAQATALYKKLLNVQARFQKLASWKAGGVLLDDAIAQHESIVDEANELNKQVNAIINRAESVQPETHEDASSIVTVDRLEVVDVTPQSMDIYYELRNAKAGLTAYGVGGTTKNGDGEEIEDVIAALNNLLERNARDINKSGARMQINRANNLLERLNNSTR